MNWLPGQLEERLDEQKRESALLRAEIAAMKHAVVFTIGGTVEGHPTSEINYLQRLRELVAAEKRGLDPRRLDALADRIACSLWGYFKGGSAGSADAMCYFDNNKKSGGCAHVIERVRNELRTLESA